MTTPLPYPVGTTDARHVLLGVLAGDNHLEYDVLHDLEEMRNGNAGPVAALLLVDVFGGARVVEISAKVDVKIQTLGVISTGDPQVLTTFFSRALVSYPRVEHIAVLLAGHGQGVLAEKEDEGAVLLRRKLTARPPRWLARTGKPWRQAPPPPSILDDKSGGLLSTREVGVVLGAAKTLAAHEGKLDALYLDACMSAMIEILAEIAPHFDVFVASQHLEDAAGWNYETLFGLFGGTHPNASATWGNLAVEAFRAEYQNLADEENPATLSAHFTLDAIVSSFTLLVCALEPMGKQGFDQVLAVAQASQTLGRPDLVDLADFAVRAKGSFAGTPVAAACENLIEALVTACIANVALGPTVKDARGLSFYLPRSQDLYFFQKDTYPFLTFCQRTGWAAYFEKHLPVQ